MSLARIAVYTKDRCQPCNATKRRLKAADVAFDEVAVDQPEHADALAYVRDARGFRESPVVIVYDADDRELDAWSGYDPDRLDAAIATIGAA